MSNLRKATGGLIGLTSFGCRALPRSASENVVVSLGPSAERGSREGQANDTRSNSTRATEFLKSRADR
jgi:hypothetical protein